MLLEDTGNEVSAENEAELLSKAFGPPNADGVYGAPEAQEVQEQEGSDN
jgi:hypothetical protein